MAVQDKQARREVILQAAATLFAEREDGLPSASEIAAKAGLAKGTIYIYFQTKEEIFVALLALELQALLNEVAHVFASADAPPGTKVAAFIDLYARHLERRPELLRMDALGYGVLEANLDAEKKLAFKLGFAGRLADTGRVIEAALALSSGRGGQLLMRSFALTRGLWQSTGAAAASFAGDVRLGLLYADFQSELRDALAEYWRGALMDG